MELFKKILKIACISLAVILGIFIIIITLMFIFPNFKIFGTRFMRSKNTESSPIVYSLSENTEYNIIANTQTFDIEIIENKETNDISISYIDGKWGFANVSESQLVLKNEGNTLEARMLETSGWLFGSGKLIIKLPINNKIDLNINTTKGNISINNGHINSLAINMTDGKLMWKAEDEIIVSNEEDNDTTSEQSSDDSSSESTNNQDSTNEETEEPKTEIVPLKEITIQSISIFTKKADIDLSCFEIINVSNKFLINSDKLELNLKTLNANTQIICPNLDLDITQLIDTEELQIFTNKGSIKIDSLQCTDKATIITTSASININTVNCLTYLATNSGNITVNLSNNAITLKTESGNTKIVEGKEDITITTTSGNIEINKYYNSADIITKTGDISIHNVGEQSAGRDTKISQDSGKIVAITEGNELRIKSAKGSNIKVTFRKMCLDEDIKHYINNTSGTTDIYIMMDQHPFNVRAIGDVSGELGNIVNMTASSEYIMYIPDNDHNTYSDICSINVEGGIVKFTGIYE